jgi:hypothetical protein
MSVFSRDVMPFSRDVMPFLRDVMPVILALRHRAELRNLNPKHLDYMCDLDANRCDGATQRDE